jgi:glycosyltransferase involved in cell wall biosynthesis
MGYVKDLGEVFDRVRLTVAPLTFGAGIKGKVIESLNAGVPCACTPIAAEGLNFPPVLQRCIAEGADGLAALICELHDNELTNEICSRGGLDYVGSAFSSERLDIAMLRMLGAAAPAPLVSKQNCVSELSEEQDAEVKS